MSSIEERLAGESTALPWIPDPDKAAKYDKDCVTDNPLIGVAVDHFRRTNFRGDGEYDVVVIRKDDGSEAAVHCQPTVLSNEMRSARPRSGENVGIKWLGMKQGANQEYAAYKVVVERTEGGTFDWGDGTATPQPESQVRDYDNRSAEAPPPSDDDIPF